MTCTWGAWWHLPAALVGTYLAILGHELTHYIGMVPVAEDVELRVSDLWLSDLEVVSEIRDEQWRHQWADVVGVLPALIGVSVLVVWSQIGWPRTDMVGLAQWNALLWYAFLGGLSDYASGKSVVEDGDPEPSTPIGQTMMPDGGYQKLELVREQHRLTNATMLGILAALLGYVYAGNCTGTVAETGQSLAFLSLLLSVSSIGLIFARVEELQDED